MLKLSRNKSIRIIDREIVGANEDIHENVCIFKNTHETDFYSAKPRTGLVNSQVVIFDRCDENFVCYSIHNDRIFPWVKIIMLNSRPCEAITIHRMEQRQGIIFYIHENWWSYRERWGRDTRSSYESSNIRMIDSREYNCTLASLHN